MEIPHGQPGHDKAFKVRPVIDSVLQKCLTLYKPHRETSVDEAMVKFKGQSSLKLQYSMRLNIIHDMSITACS